MITLITERQGTAIYYCSPCCEEQLDTLALWGKLHIIVVFVCQMNLERKNDLFGDFYLTFFYNQMKVRNITKEDVSVFSTMSGITITDYQW